MTTIAEYPVADTAGGVLARAYLAGDREAFATLFRRYYPDLLWFLSGRLRDHALAEDLAQETLLRALRSMPTYDPTREIWPWLRTIASRLASAESTKRGAELPVEEVDRGVGSREDDSDAVLARDAVLQALSTIPPRQSRALVMRYVEDRDPSDIADLFGMSRGALEQLLWRARRSFAKEYRQRNAAVVPGFATLAARLRRLLHGFETKLQFATGATMSLAGDVALGAALTAGGIGLAVAAQPAAAAPRTALTHVRTVASVTTPAAGRAADARDSATHLAATAAEGGSSATAAAPARVGTAPRTAPGDEAPLPLAPDAPEAPPPAHVGGTGHVDQLTGDSEPEPVVQTTRTDQVSEQAPAEADKVADATEFADGYVPVEVVEDEGSTAVCATGTCVKT